MLLTKSPGEVWRFDWACRVTLSTAVVSIICLHPATQNVITRSGRHPLGGPFSAYVCLMVSETSLGATIHKSWGCLVASAAASFLCWISWSLLKFWRFVSLYIY